MRKIITVFLFVLVTANYSNAQKVKNLSIAATSETASFPFSRYAPIHPELEIRTRLWQQEKEKSLRTVNVYAGGYYHKKIENGFYLRTDYTHLKN